MRFETAVLARRFTMICLMAMIFGLAFAALIESASRPARAVEPGQLNACTLVNGMRCAPVN
jgi:hypothetical protein